MRLPVLLALLLAAHARAAATVDGERDLIGWSERTSGGGGNGAAGGKVVRDFSGVATDDASPVAPSGRPANARMEVLSWEPRIFLFRNILSPAECDHLVALAEPRLSRSGVVKEGGGDEISEIRTSSGMFFERGEDAVVSAVESRISEWSLIPVSHGEGIQVLQYEASQKYEAHFDAFFEDVFQDNGGQRLATVLMYLADVEEGGETVFPNVPPPASQTREAGFSECAMKGLAVRPRKGDAVLFFSLRPDGVLSKGSLHGGCPVIKGVKYAATKWYHVGPYAMGGEAVVHAKHVVYRPPPAPAPPGCFDSKPGSCPGWAESGECESNPGYMVGTKEHPGECLLSCGRCDLMPEGAADSHAKGARRLGRP